MVTINDIAKSLGVAKSTVSNALTGNRYVSEDLKEKILEKCEEMNFQPNFFATTLSKPTGTNIIGLFLELGEDKVYQDFYDSLIKSCIQTSSDYDYSIIIYYGLNAQKTISLLNYGKSPIDGAIMLSPQIIDTRAEQIAANSIPCVVIGRPSTNNLNTIYVDNDNNDLISTIVRKLTELSHEKIVFINSKKDLTISEDRVTAFLKSLKENHLSVQEHLILNAEKSSVEEGRNIIHQLINEKHEFTAVITANDLLARGVYEGLNSHDLVVGEDISVIALGGEKYIGEELTPHLSYAHQDYFEIGNMATRLIIDKLLGNSVDSENMIFKSSVHFTDSCSLNVKLAGGQNGIYKGKEGREDRVSGSKSI